MRVPFAFGLLCAHLAHAQSGTIAALPLSNASSNRSVEWVGEAVAAAIREALASRGLLVLERDDLAEALKRLGIKERAPLTLASAMKTAESLDAELVVFGQFKFETAAQPTQSKIDVSLRIAGRKASQVVDVRDSGTLASLSTLENHLAWQILSKLARGYVPPEDQAGTLRLPSQAGAEEAHARGLMETAPEQREKYFNQALTLDPKYSDPAFHLGELYYGRKDFKKAAELLVKVDARDSHFRMASFMLGLARFQSADYAGAIQTFAAIAEQAPLPEVLNNLAAAESRRGIPQALADYRRAVEADPNDTTYRFNLGYFQWKTGDFNSAVDSFRATVVRDPDDSVATLLLGRSLNKQGLRSDASDAKLRNLERIKENYDETAWRQLKLLIEGAAK